MKHVPILVEVIALKQTCGQAEAEIIRKFGCHFKPIFKVS